MITTAAVALIASAVVFVLVVKLSSSPDAKKNLGSQTFLLNRAPDLAREVTEHGPPLFQAPQGGGDRDIYVNHLGRDTKTGWIAFKAYTSRRTCQLQWSQRTKRFTDPCTRKTYGADPGPDFTHYKVVVLPNGRVEVDFRPPTTTTGAVS